MSPTTEDLIKRIEHDEVYNKVMFDSSRENYPTLEDCSQQNVCLGKDINTY
jgi:hypothetical protein